jgi:hypothetical protein
MLSTLSVIAFMLWYVILKGGIVGNISAINVSARFFSEASQGYFYPEMAWLAAISGAALLGLLVLNLGLWLWRARTHWRTWRQARARAA